MLKINSLIITIVMLQIIIKNYITLIIFKNQFIKDLF